MTTTTFTTLQMEVIVIFLIKVFGMIKDIILIKMAMILMVI